MRRKLQETSHREETIIGLSRELTNWFNVFWNDVHERIAKMQDLAFDSIT